MSFVLRPVAICMQQKKQLFFVPLLSTETFGVWFVLNSNKPLRNKANNLENNAAFATSVEMALGRLALIQENIIGTRCRHNNRWVQDLSRDFETGGAPFHPERKTLETRKSVP